MLCHLGAFYLDYASAVSGMSSSESWLDRITTELAHQPNQRRPSCALPLRPCSYYRDEITGTFAAPLEPERGRLGLSSWPPVLTRATAGMTHARHRTIQTVVGANHTQLGSITHVCAQCTGADRWLDLHLFRGQLRDAQADERQHDVAGQGRLGQHHRPAGQWPKCSCCWRRTLNYGTCAECVGKPCLRHCCQVFDGKRLCPEHWPRRPDSQLQSDHDAMSNDV